jgi:hypothetical protein
MTTDGFTVFADGDPVPPVVGLEIPPVGMVVAVGSDESQLATTATAATTAARRTRTMRIV